MIGIFSRDRRKTAFSYRLGLAERELNTGKCSRPFAQRSTGQTDNAPSSSARSTHTGNGTTGSAEKGGPNRSKISRSSLSGSSAPSAERCTTPLVEGSPRSKPTSTDSARAVTSTGRNLAYGTRLCSQLFLCLSRACLGKLIVFLV